MNARGKEKGEIMAANIKIKLDGKQADVYTPYSAEFVKKIKSIGGAKWNSSKSCWSIPADAVEHCRKLMQEIYGETDIPSAEPRVRLRVKFLLDYEEMCAPIHFFGKNIASARGRDSGATPGDGIIFEEGKPDSSGSKRCWTTRIRKDTVVVIPDVPVSMYKKDKDAANPWGDKLFETEIIKESSINRSKLEEEKASLLARIMEIDKLLESLA